MEIELGTLLQEVDSLEGSDLHLVVGQPPIYRINGTLTPREAGPILDSDLLTALLLPHLNDQARTQLEAGHDVLVTLRQSDGISRDSDGIFRMSNGGERQGEAVFRMNIFREQGRLAAAIRVIPTRVPTLETLGLTADKLPCVNNESILHALTNTPRGLILIAGSTGSGKSTLAAAMIEEINQTRSERILTVEQPIEYVFQSKKSLITQRAVGEDVSDFPAALRSALRSDPDVVFVGQSVNIETLVMTLGSANMGHLVFTVLHVDSVSEAIQRVLDPFQPGPQQEATRRLLARNLVAVIVQKLLVHKGGKGRLAVQEILVASPRVKQMILEGQTDFTVAIEAGRNLGMQTMDDAVIASYERGDISYETALFNVSERDRIPPSAA